ncbi:hypothetical protein [Elioraea rosea]|uniref:hypothetical protein n=1 Tax=Elioraea rosea TaxID=2492390 RepID=UPI00118638B5|nr:hypothetical protein [Elioraea rosea]
MKTALALVAPAALALAAAHGSAAAQQRQAQPRQDGAVASLLRSAGVEPTEAAVAGTDAKARAQALDALEKRYDLPRSLLDRENTPPPNAAEVMDRLGLVRHPGVPMTDLSGRTPTAREITDALGPR